MKKVPSQHVNLSLKMSVMLRSKESCYLCKCRKCKNSLLIALTKLYYFKITLQPPVVSPVSDDRGSLIDSAKDDIQSLSFPAVK